MERRLGMVTVTWWTEKTEGPDGQKSRIAESVTYYDASLSWPAQGPVCIETPDSGIAHLFNPAGVVTISYVPNKEAEPSNT